MPLAETVALELLHEHSHGVLGTLHTQRGVDMTPVVYAAAGCYLASPIDRVKSKSSLRLQRERNLEADPRATLLVEQWDHDDWSKLWWVRAELRWEGTAHHLADEMADKLAGAFPQYRGKPFASVLVFRVERVTGWSAADPLGA